MAEFQMCWRTAFPTQACWLELLDSWGAAGVCLWLKVLRGKGWQQCSHARGHGEVLTGMWNLWSLPCSFLQLLLTLGPAIHTLKHLPCVYKIGVRAGNRQFTS